MSDVEDIGHERERVHAQYAQTDNLITRAAVWRDDPDHGSPRTAALAEIVSRRPARILEIGCGTGEFARQLVDAIPQARLTATDRSPAMVDATRARGVTAQVVDSTSLPFADDTFDVVAAMWMLYHVPDLDRALDEISRVLRPGGSVVAATNGLDHTADLRALAGLLPAETQFMTETAADALSARFADVRIRRFAPVAELDHAGAVDDIRSFAPDAAQRIHPFEGVRTFRGSSCVITAYSYARAADHSA